MLLVKLEVGLRSLCQLLRGFMHDASRLAEVEAENNMQIHVLYLRCPS